MCDENQELHIACFHIFLVMWFKTICLSDLHVIMASAQQLYEKAIIFSVKILNAISFNKNYVLIGCGLAY